MTECFIWNIRKKHGAKAWKMQINVSREPLIWTDKFHMKHFKGFKKTEIGRRNCKKQQKRGENEMKNMFGG